MTLHAPPAQDPLDRVLESPALLEVLAAGAELSDAAAAGAAPDGLVAAYGQADALARLLLLPVLAATGSDEATRLLCAAVEGPDPAEREHAAWALAGVPPVPAAARGLTALRAQGGFPGMLAELALEPRRSAAFRAAPPRAARRRGLRIVQVFMQGWIDPGLTRAGAGDAGGIATLLVHLGAALAARPEVEEVITLARGAGRGERGGARRPHRARAVRRRRTVGEQ